MALSAEPGCNPVTGIGTLNHDKMLELHMAWLGQAPRRVEDNVGSSILPAAKLNFVITLIRIWSRANLTRDEFWQLWPPNRTLLCNYTTYMHARSFRG